MVGTDWTTVRRDAWAELFQAWVIRLAQEQFGALQWGGPAHLFTIGAPGGPRFGVAVTTDSVAIGEVSELDEHAVAAVVAEAESRTNRGELGGVVIYSATFRTSGLTSAEDIFDLLKTIGTQVHIDGPRRLSNVVVLDFRPEIPEHPDTAMIFAPATVVDAVIYVPGPVWSPLTDRVASGITETTAALCAVALGRPVTSEGGDFPIGDDGIPAALSRRSDMSIRGLARDGVSLDIFGDLRALGGESATLRGRSSALALHGAMAQQSADISMLLLVTAIEALVAPAAEWGKERVVKRFVNSVIELCPTTVDEIAAHEDAGDALGFSPRGSVNRQRREILDLIYASRSRITHSGLSLSPPGLTSFASPTRPRITLTTELAFAAFLSYLSAPRSSVVGYPPLTPSSD